ncbi:hypothetical protein KUTeg_010452 [Tegillarca granosa]|uniref:Uncharacterized protein n=1 Tax=Tegillarca granosa TaxID=220873 RepID=A0ABQ9F6Y0_TEGGR|nr:hypothetical protein KUTeg_010452 [Tegillarca granosa]
MNTCNMHLTHRRRYLYSSDYYTLKAILSGGEFSVSIGGPYTSIAFEINASLKNYSSLKHVSCFSFSDVIIVAFTVSSFTISTKRIPSKHFKKCISKNASAISIAFGNFRLIKEGGNASRQVVLQIINE